MFQPVDGNVKFPEQELAVGKFWKEHGIYEKSLAQRQGAEPFVFYEGPPTANGMPHPGHCLTRAIKDLFPRYQTMRGKLCQRKAGWDTHGLPVEVEVCKELGIHSKEEIEAYGIEKFIQLCQQSVWRYMQEWRRLTERLGFWVDLDDAYVTYHQSFVESVWWSLKNLFDRGLLYQGHKIVWWWAQGGTALSAGEVGQGYRQVADPSVYVKFPLLDDAGKVTDTSLLVWTTTPWTLPANQFAAVNDQLSYVRLLDPLDGSRLIVAEALADSIASKLKKEFVTDGEAFSGRELVGKRYVPPFSDYYDQLKNKVVCTASPNGKGPAADYMRSVALTLGIGSDEAWQPGAEHLSRVEKKLDEWHANNRERRVGWTVDAAPFVTIDSGSGIVHIAPAFGEADFNILAIQRLALEDPDEIPLLCPVAPNGSFTSEAPKYCEGRWVKDCDKDIIRDLKQRGLLFHQEQYLHDYPFCWRAEEDPLIQYPRESWFIRTTAFRQQMLANNEQINWMPSHIKHGRFGKFLESNVDWALSRERYWGTPLPIWICNKCGYREAIAAFSDLTTKPSVSGLEAWSLAKKRNPDIAEDLKVHKPYIDEISYSCTGSVQDCQGTMHRVKEVIDCWYDSGAMPFAQWGYKGLSTSGPPTAESVDEKQGEKRRFEADIPFPADFISEAIDQTRGWFYTQLAIHTMLFGVREDLYYGYAEEEVRESMVRPTNFPHPFKNCIVLGLMLGEDGQKMSKSKRNYLPPNEIFDKYGADALRWYFFANQPPWTSIRYSEQAIKDSIPEFLLRLWNVYSFFVIYANIDEFDPAGELASTSGKFASLDSTTFTAAKSYRPVKDRSELDRWILSELNRTVAAVVERMDAYDNFAACGHITEFVDALSNWYVRRSRDRFWAADKRGVEKLDAYWTLYECLVTSAKLVAPFVPFVADTLWRNLAGVFQGKAAESVHLCDYPKPDSAVVDESLSERMNLVRLISSLGRNARTSAALKVRQPLSKVEVVLADTKHQAWLAEHADVINEELNVKQLEFCDDPSQYVDHEVNPNFKLLGPKLGKLLPKVKAWLAKQSGAELLANIRDNGLIDVEIDGEKLALTREEVEVRIKPKPGWTSANDRGVVVVLSTQLTPELVAEGMARDVVRVAQDARKETGCDFTDRIELGLVVVKGEPLKLMLASFAEYIQNETLAVKLVSEPIAGVNPIRAKIGETEVDFYIRVVRQP